jgi:hypothetical protein
MSPTSLATIRPYSHLDINYRGVDIKDIARGEAGASSASTADVHVVIGPRCRMARLSLIGFK